MRTRASLYVLLLMVLMVLQQCYAAAPREVLDRQTGATLIIASDPYVFARDQPQLAANARDYVNLYPVLVSIGGRRSYFLVGFIWSTIDRRGAAAPVAADLALTIDDRRLILEPSGQTPRDLGIATWPMDPPGRGARLVVYPTDTGVLRQLVAAQIAMLRYVHDGDGNEEPLVIWRDGRAALREFLDAN